MGDSDKRKITEQDSIKGRCEEPDNLKSSAKSLTIRSDSIHQF